MSSFVGVEIILVLNVILKINLKRLFAGKLKAVLGKLLKDLHVLKVKIHYD
ncbi:MAG: hypothetical protein NZ601_04035 [candidate division WOR-3 bacterium]|nr:hypothetical protein [candidate division WOR-3 bacterium]MCX7757504.1 hypothetical protein [candidate division WOR-3 bacterium]MDW7987160.1 hypothetical protein [candidate division WOR-3 bacterium]